MALHPEILSNLRHPTVAAVRRSLGQVGGGAPTAFIVEGAPRIAQALAAGAPVESVLFLEPVAGAEEQALLASLSDQPAACHLVARGVFFRLLDLGYETATRVLATVRAEPLPPERLEELIDADACVLAGERIQDPRNVGVLIRTAEALGVRAAVFGPGSADPYCRAAVRSTTGSILRLPLVLPPSLPDALAGLRSRGVRLVGSSARASLPCWAADLATPCAIIVGNETTGLSVEAQDLCDALVTIPMQGDASSLNVTVAGGALLYEVLRQRACR
ncbi:MAG: RNA methyltransferase [Armatimonadetes bacterium]|nr:RNA methyltransferase [Armatimonadota bacterium]